jgi:glycosyltransferase involved in cell wall biosynthesis
MSMPLVSCIMPTCNRPAFAARAFLYFVEQDYPRKELIIFDDTPGGPSLQFVQSGQVKVLYREGRHSLGEKRNAAVEFGGGDVIVHWDDDDWMHRRRISLQIDALLDSNCDVSGLDRMLFYDLRTRRTWLYSYPSDGKRWLAGGSLCYWRRIWEDRKFKPMTRGEDTHFVWTPPELRLHALANIQFYVALIHSGNTCTKSLCGPCWQPWHGPSFQELAGPDWEHYRLGWQVGNQPQPARVAP